MKTVLIVDDAKVSVDITREILTRHGYNVIGDAENGEDGLEKYKDLSPDLVIMDITMPRVDGIKGIELIKAYDRTARIIVCSAMGQRSLVMEALQKGASSYVVKPFTEEQLITAANKVFNI